jgi:hypothetical protein
LHACMLACLIACLNKKTNYVLLREIWTMAEAYPPSGENPAWGQPVMPPPQQYYAPTQTFPPPNSGVWTTGICGCCEEIESCVWTHHLHLIISDSWSLSLSLSLDFSQTLRMDYLTDVVVECGHNK